MTGADGKPSTWFPLERLVEQEFLNIDFCDFSKFIISQILSILESLKLVNPNRKVSFPYKILVL